MKVLFGGRSHRVLYRGLTRLVRDLQPDVIYANAEPESFLAFQVLTARRRSGARSAVILDSWRNIAYGKSGFPYKTAFLHHYIERRSVRDAEWCVVHTATSQSILRESGFPLTTVIPPAVDTRLFAMAEGYADTSPDLRVGFVGRLVPEKGVDTLMHAFACLPARCRLVIVGGGPFRSELERLSKALSIASRVSWLGPVPHNRIPRVLQGLDVCVLPSRTTRTWKEQFGRILIEAMACGVPVVGSGSGEIPAVIGEAGMVFQEDNSTDLASCLTRLFSDASMRNSFAARGRQRVRRLFDTQVVAALYAELFRAVAAG